MKSSVIVAGIYDKRTIQRLKEVGVDQLSFDFRAKSFNFLQQHIFMQLQQELQIQEKIYLHFENEADFVISKILDDLKLSRGSANTYLEFSDMNSDQFYDKFETPFLWHYNFESPFIDKIPNAKYLRGIIFKFSDLLKLHEDGVLLNFCNNFHSLYINCLKDENFKLILQLDWDSNLFASISEHFDFTDISLNISDKVEICYRNVDLSKVSGHIEYLRNIDL
ncbi:hypothetical protein [Halobacteriovorax marinus]|nr:hypothetical protein [Halobacteriovorax marinus]